MVKEPDQMRIADMPPSAVPYEKPFCYIHQCFYIENYLRRKNDEENRTLEIKRVWECEKCGAKSRTPITGKRTFKKSRLDLLNTDKVPNDEN